MDKHTLSNYISQHKDRMLSELMDLLKIPSVSADSKYKDAVLKTAESIKQRLVEAGADKVEVCPTKGFPVVYGEKIIDPAKPTVVVYGHYDVQPPDPLNLWDSPPFEPVIKKRPSIPMAPFLHAVPATTKARCICT